MSTLYHGSRHAQTLRKGLEFFHVGLVVRADPPAALDLRPGERGRVHAVPERAALEELLLFHSDRQYKAFLFTGIS